MGAPARQIRIVRAAHGATLELPSGASAEVLSLASQPGFLECAEALLRGAANVHVWRPGARNPWPAMRGVHVTEAFAAHLASAVEFSANVALSGNRDTALAEVLSNRPRLTSGKEIAALGLGYEAEHEAQWFEFDLDDLPVAAKFLAALRKRVPHVQVTSSSHRTGRYRARFRIEPMRVSDIQRHGRALVESLGFRVANGAIEIYPSRKNGRVPFGPGGCTLFDAGLSRGRECHPLELFEALIAMPAIDLAELAPVHRVERISGGSVRKPRSHVAFAKAIRYWQHGVSGPGERDDALHSLACWFGYQGKTESEATEQIRTWIRSGGLSRSRAVLKCGPERELADVPRRVAATYETLRPCTPAKPAHLTRTEIARLVSHAFQVADSQAEARRIIRLGLAVLPIAKGAHLAGRTSVRIHSSKWQAAGGSRVTRLRQLLGWREVDGSYREGRRAKEWRWAFEFERIAPPKPAIAVRASAEKQVLLAVAIAAKSARKLTRSHTKDSPRTNVGTSSHPLQLPKQAPHRGAAFSGAERPAHSCAASASMIKVKDGHRRAARARSG